LKERCAENEECEKSAQPKVKSIPIEKLRLLDSDNRILRRRYGIFTIGDLLVKTEYDLRSGNVPVGMLERIKTRLGEVGLRLKGDIDLGFPTPSAEVIAKSDDIETDTAIIMDILQKLGYEWDEQDEGLQWAMEAILFSMNNPKLAVRLKTYLWTEIAKREGLNVSEITTIIRSSVKKLKPTWKELDLHVSPEDAEAKEVWNYARRVFRQKGSGSCDVFYHDKNIRFSFELAAIGCYAHEVRREMRKKRG
jgi:hypothetical protein